MKGLLLQVWLTTSVLSVSREDVFSPHRCGFLQALQFHFTVKRHVVLWIVQRLEYVNFSPESGQESVGSFSTFVQCMLGDVRRPPSPRISRYRDGWLDVTLVKHLTSIFKACSKYGLTGLSCTRQSQLSQFVSRPRWRTTHWTDVLCQKMEQAVGCLCASLWHKWHVWALSAVKVSCKCLWTHRLFQLMSPLH